MLYRNDIFTFDGRTHRLLDVHAATDQAWIICLDEPLPWPKVTRWSDIARCAATQNQRGAQFREPTASMRACRDASLARIQPLVERTPAIYDAEQRGYMIETRAAELGCSERTIHRNLRRYWTGGQVPDALLGNFDRSGRKEAGQTAGRGRTPVGEHHVFQLTDADVGFIKNVIEKIYLKDSRISMAAAFQRMLEQHYVIQDGNGRAYIRPFGARPTIRQFRHFLHSNYSLEVRIRGREGDKDFERDHRAKLGTIAADCLGVGHYYEIDATIADIYLVSSESVDIIIGKPTLYLIIDRKSHLIVGFYVGLENASWIGAMEAILSISTNKVELCAHYGVKHDPEDWPSHEVFPKEFLADRGEMLSKASGQVSDGLQVTVTSLPGKRPDWKPLVECGFKLIHEDIRDIVPAYDPPSNAMKRRGKHFEKDACLTLKNFAKIILESVIAHNRKAMRNYDLSLAEITAGIMPSPIAIWNHNIVERAGVLTRFPESHVRHALLPRDIAAVTDEGIVFRGCFYTCPEAIAKGWFVSARNKRLKINVSYDSRLVDMIYVHSSESGGQPVQATITTRSEKYRGLSFAEVKFYERLKSAARPAIEQNRSQTMMEFHQKVDPVTDAAKKKLRDDGKGISRTARRADIKNDRAAELRNERQRLASVKTVTTRPTGPTAKGKVVSLPIREHTKATTQTTISENSMPPEDEMTAKQRAQEARRKMLSGY